MHPEDIKPGNWVAITAFDPTGATPSSIRHPTALDVNVPRKDLTLRITEYTGVPMKVLAVSLPFMLVQYIASAYVEALDVRTKRFTKLNKKFIKEFGATWGTNILNQQNQQHPHSFTSQEEQHNEDDHGVMDLVPHESLCPLCYNRLHEAQSTGPDTFLVCTACGWSNQ